MKPEIYYISGPMTGLPGYNHDAFHEAQADLESRLGVIVMNPANIKGHSSWSWQQRMRFALSLQVRADVVHMLPGWRKSRGARIERRLALILGQRVEGADA